MESEAKQKSPEVAQVDLQHVENEMVQIDKTEYEYMMKVIDETKKIFGICSNKKCTRILCIRRNEITGAEYRLNAYTPTPLRCYSCNMIFCHTCASRRWREVFCDKCDKEWDSGC